MRWSILALVANLAAAALLLATHYKPFDPIEAWVVLGYVALGMVAGWFAGTIAAGSRR